MARIKSSLQSELEAKASDEIAVKNCTLLLKFQKRSSSSDDTIKSGNSRFSDLENYPIFFTRRDARVRRWIGDGRKGVRKMPGCSELRN